jgi:predicted aspartyl protease
LEKNCACGGLKVKVEAQNWRTPELDTSDDLSPQVASVNFTVHMDAGILVLVDIGGVKVWSMIDTGASMSVIDEALAKKLGLAVIGSTTLQSDVGFTFRGIAKCPSIKLGGMSLAPTSALLAPLSSLMETVGRQVSLIIGQDALTPKLLEIDLPNRKLSLWDRKLAAIPPGFQQIALMRGPQGRRCINILIEGVSTAAVFDLGRSNAVMLSQRFSVREGFLAGRKLSTAATGTLSGIEISTTCRLRDLTIAGFSVLHAPAEVFSSWICEDVPVNLGLPTFQDFRMLVDFAGDSLWLSRIKGPQTPFRVDRAGLGLAFERDYLRVVHVALGGPAEHAGWQIGSEITAIDDHRIDADYVESGLCQWRFGEPGRTVKLNTSDGRSHELVLRDYI